MLGGVLVFNKLKTTKPMAKIAIDNNIGEDNSVLNYRGNYYDLMLVRGKAMMNNKLYDVYSGWLSPDKEVFFGSYGVEVQQYNNGNNFIGAKVSEDHDGVMAPWGKVFVIENGVERLAKFDDKFEIERSGFFTFRALCEPEKEPLGFWGKVAKACPGMGPHFLNCEKIVFQKPNEGEEVQFKAKSFNNEVGDTEDSVGVIPEEKQGVQMVNFEIKTKDGTQKVSFVPAAMKSSHGNDKLVYFKIDGFKKPISMWSDSWEWNLYNSMVSDYDISGKYLCSPFNDFCFLRIDKLIINTNFKLGPNFNVSFSNFNYFNSGLLNKPYLNFDNGKWILKVYSNERRLGDFKVDVSDYIDSNEYLKEMKKKYELKESSTEDQDWKDYYMVKTTGVFNCGEVYEIIKEKYLQCVVEPTSFDMGIILKAGIIGEVLPAQQTTSTSKSSNNNQ